jgi:hypothetical protein
MKRFAFIKDFTLAGRSLDLGMQAREEIIQE